WLLAATRASETMCAIAAERTFPCLTSALPDHERRAPNVAISLASRSACSKRAARLINHRRTPSWLVQNASYFERTEGVVTGFSTGSSLTFRTISATYDGCDSEMARRRIEAA